MSNTSGLSLHETPSLGLELPGIAEINSRGAVALRDPFPTEAIDPLSIAPRIDEAMGSLYLGGRAVHSDGMYLAAARPRRPLGEVVADYQVRRGEPGFSAVEYWQANFETPEPDDTSLVAPSGMSVGDYARWIRPNFIHPSTEREDGINMWLPNDTLVAGGGRYKQPVLYHWDSYHAVKGLAADGEWGRVLDTVDNTEYLINQLGYAPNASVSYLATRSQPPYFSHEVSMLAEQYGDEALVRYLPAMEREYEQYWMDGKEYLEKQPDDGRVHTHRTLVRMPIGNGKFAFLNRYWDDADGPRLESYQEDVELGEMVTHGLGGAVRERRLQKLYKDIRAGAASGWDQSSRWFGDSATLATIETSDIVPVDLNSLLARTEKMLALAHRAANNPSRAMEYEDRFRQRVDAINRVHWDPQNEIYRDYNFVRGHQTAVESAAMAYPLYVGIATPGQTSGVARAIEDKLLFPGGIVATTTDESDQQWDGGTKEGDGQKNVWAPLNWAGARGLARMAHMFKAAGVEVDVQPWLELSERVRSSYMSGVEIAFNVHGTVPEKHRGDNPAQIGQGGEYQAVTAFAMASEIFVAMETWNPRDPNGCLPIGATALTHAV